MHRSSRHGGRKLCALLCVLTVGAAVSSCADSGAGPASGGSADSGSALSIGTVNEQPEAGSPVDGGTLTFSGYSAVTTLDPSKTQTAGAAGGSELTAIYDVLVRYDPAARSFVPQLAQSLEPNVDSTTWTLKLRDGVTFSDGTALDSKAVARSIARYVANKGPQSALWAAKVSSVDTPDPSTVVFHLADPWTGIESLLATGPGMIVAPTVDEAGTFRPIGAGAFTLEKFAPNDEIVLAARRDYHGGSPHIDKLRLISIVGAQPTADALTTGGIDVAYLRTLGPILQLIGDGHPGFVDIPSLGYLANVNMAPGRPGSDLRVRQAITYAVDPEALDVRVNDGKGLPGQTIFQDTSRWNNDVPPIGVDPAKARNLLDRAKADGYDGRITFLAYQAPASQDTALAVQAMLNAVGFDTRIEYVSSVGDQIKRMFVDRDYDMSSGAISLSEADPFERLSVNIRSGAPSNVTGYSDTEMDGLLDELGVATSDDAKRSVLARIQERANATLPWQVWGNVPTLDVWNADVHGLKLNVDGIILFDDAWKS